MLFSRTILFLSFQTLFFVGFALAKAPAPWEQSANWWPFTATFTNLISFFVVDKLLKRENRSFREFFDFENGRVLKGIMIVFGLLLVAMPVAMIPNMVLSNALFGNFELASKLFFRPLPLWAILASLVVFPVTMPLGELPLYFGYIMPRLETITKSKWLALALPSLMLSFQHAALPLLFNRNIIILRLFMFLPFAVLIGLVIRWKPKLFPYILIAHFLMDVGTVITLMFFTM